MYGIFQTTESSDYPMRVLEDKYWGSEPNAWRDLCIYISGMVSRQIMGSDRQVELAAQPENYRLVVKRGILEDRYSILEIPQ